MVSNCANPACGRPLHYLREGRIFLFNDGEYRPGSTLTLSRRLEHYWLCGDCAPRMRLVKDALGVHIILRSALPHDSSDAPRAMTTSEV